MAVVPRDLTETGSKKPILPPLGPPLVGGVGLGMGFLFAAKWFSGVGVRPGSSNPLCGRVGLCCEHVLFGFNSPYPCGCAWAWFSAPKAISRSRGSRPEAINACGCLHSRDVVIIMIIIIIIAIITIIIIIIITIIAIICLIPCPAY